MGESAAQSRFEVAVSTGLTPLVGRDEELALLQRRWDQAKDGEGQVVLLSGEARDWQIPACAGAERARYRRRSHTYRVSLLALSPKQCALSDHRPPAAPLAVCSARILPTPSWRNSNTLLSHYRFPQADTLPLLAALLSLTASRRLLRRLPSVRRSRSRRPRRP